MSEQSVEQAEAVVDNDIDGLDTEPSEIIDEDRMGADPLEDGMDAAEGYSRDVRLGGTRRVGDQPTTIDYRLPQEQPDAGAPRSSPDRPPVGATPIDDLDESIDDPENAVDGVGGGVVLDAAGGRRGAEDEQLTEDGREVELGRLVRAAAPSRRPACPPTTRSARSPPIDNEPGTARSSRRCTWSRRAERRRGRRAPVRR